MTAKLLERKKRIEKRYAQLWKRFEFKQVHRAESEAVTL